MFGMSDPNQTLSQMIRYFEEERHEMVEVMASEFTSMLLANKQRDGAMQTLLVKGVRILAEVLSIRGKDKLAIQATSVLLRERKKLEKILSQTAPSLLSKLTPIEQYYRTIGSVYAKAGKASKAKKFFFKAHKNTPGNLAAILDGCLNTSLEPPKQDRFGFQERFPALKNRHRCLKSQALRFGLQSLTVCNVWFSRHQPDRRQERQQDFQAYFCAP